MNLLELLGVISGNINSPITDLANVTAKICNVPGLQQLLLAQVPCRDAK
jgi:hypothetical protein